jgi:hypothetical protein
MNDIVSNRDTEALAFAREIIRRSQAEEVEIVFGIKARWLADGASRRFVVDVMKQFARWRVENLMDLVDRARLGSPVADEAARELILEYINDGKAVPTYLAAFNMEIVSGRIPKQRGKQKADYFLRDMAVLVTIILVMDKFGLAPTSRNGRNTCACSIVSDALFAENLGIGYKAVAEIWRRYKHSSGAPYDEPGRVLK